MFQSHLGSISTLDQFLEAIAKRWFQSHLGSISTVKASICDPPLSARFNPTLVRLALRRGSCPGVVDPVSIPPWFD